MAGPVVQSIRSLTFDTRGKSTSVSNIFLLTKAAFAPFSSISPLPDIKHLKQTHAKLIRNSGMQDVLTVGKLIADIAVSDPSNLDYARSVFTTLEYPPNIFMWNSMIRGYSHSSKPDEAVLLYREMLEKGFSPNNYTYPFVFKVCTQLKDLNLGLGIHGSVVRRGFEDCDAFIQTSLLNFYASCGSINVARLLFDRCPERDVTSWNALIKGYVRCNQYMGAVNVFRMMQDTADCRADEITLLGVVLACTQLGALAMGGWVHAYIDKHLMKMSTNLGTALVDMYARCGSIDAAMNLFKGMTERDVRTWSVMIGGLAIHGLANEALDLFREMQRDGIPPDSITFTSALCACSHAGMVAEGLLILDKMSKVYNMEPTIEHYGCIVDLLGRAGLLEDALAFIKRIPLKPDVVLWGSLLVACRAHKNVEMGEMVAKEMLKLDAHHCGAHVFLSNVYASTGRWAQVEEVRSFMKEQRIRKQPGSSLMEFNGDVHEFIAGDRSHPQISQIHMMLNEIARLLSLEGYLPATRGIALDIDEEEKEQALSLHSEKLAVAFGLINTKQGAVLRIVKNLRVCEDCHSAMKLISKVFNRLIIIRDRSRFHHFEDGSCSCRDYW
ncbi:pentatricopeptide repeat-containing protein At5g66520-like [Telopea speciosissima]|uniref:pentatricopeptide repeat-containing protein At5g66520-like n=1 Tax=Telopea speciosissima TaxID=54955 RepID=UPI001CC6E364|nr:pentatricopeptide repeat-containing protein At5g66520-like [Telopea speciosissima]